MLKNLLWRVISKITYGQLQIIEIILGILVCHLSYVACSVNGEFDQCNWGEFVSGVGTIIVIGFTVFYAFCTDYNSHTGKILFCEIIFYFLWSFLYLSAALVLRNLAYSEWWWVTETRDASLYGSYLAFVATPIFGCHTGLKLYRRNEERKLVL